MSAKIIPNPNSNISSTESERVSAIKKAFILLSSCGCESDVMHSVWESVIEKPSSSSSRDRYIHLCANTLEKGMNLLPPLSYGLNSETLKKC